MKQFILAIVPWTACGFLIAICSFNLLNPTMSFLTFIGLFSVFFGSVVSLLESLFVSELPEEVNKPMPVAMKLFLAITNLVLVGFYLLELFELTLLVDNDNIILLSYSVYLFLMLTYMRIVLPLIGSKG